MGSSVLEGGRSADIHQFYLEAAKRSDNDCVEVQGSPFADCQECHFRSRMVQIIAEPYCKRFILLMFTKSGFRVRNVVICAVLSSNEVDLLLLRNCVFRLRFVQIWAMTS